MLPSRNSLVRTTGATLSSSCGMVIVWGVGCRGARFGCVPVLVGGYMKKLSLGLGLYMMMGIVCATLERVV